MLQIKRKLLALPIHHIYFQDAKLSSRYEPKLINYTHILKPTRKLKGQQTVHLDLKLDDYSLFNNLSTELQKKLIEDIHKEYKVLIEHNPNDMDIKEFQIFYNQQAKYKNQRKINNFDLVTLKLLRNKGAIRLTRLVDEYGITLCYRIDVVGNEIAMCLYECINELASNQFANEYLCWNNLKYFRNEGLKTYDFGDLKDPYTLDQLKERFGGNVVTVFSGNISKSFFSHFLLTISFVSLSKTSTS